MVVQTAERKEYMRRYYLEHKREKAAADKLYRERHRECYRGYKQKQHLRTRQVVIEHYGGKCACCGEEEPKFLAIDHVNGGGAKHRAAVGKGRTFMHWLVKNGFPPGFQVLCHNCNQAKSSYGRCPHTPKED